MITFRKIISEEIKEYKHLYNCGEFEKIKISWKNRKFPILMRVAFLSFPYIEALHGDGENLFSELYSFTNKKLESKYNDGALLNLELRAYIYLAKEAAKQRNFEFSEKFGGDFIINRQGILAIENCINYDMFFYRGSASLAKLIARREKPEYIDFFVKHEHTIDENLL